MTRPAWLDQRGPCAATSVGAFLRAYGLKEKDDRAVCLLTFVPAIMATSMNKRTKTPPSDRSVFRDSDFAGAEPVVRAKLSASLNTLSNRVITARQALAELAPLGKAPGTSETPLQAPSETPAKGEETDPDG